MGLANLIRKILSTKDERGRVTTDRFRLAVRKTVRGMVGDSLCRVLDAGGADGLLFEPAACPKGISVTVLDLEKEALLTGRKAYTTGGAFVLGDMTNMPFRDGAFDCSVCVGTFYNFPSTTLIIEGLREMARVTRKGGRVIAEFRNASNPAVAIAYRHAEKYDRSLDGLPLHAYSPGEVHAMCSVAGLKVVAVKSIGPQAKRLALGFVYETEHMNTEDTGE